MAIEDIKDLAESIQGIVSMRPNEAQTNQWLVEPFIEALGYKISDPTQVERESTADYGARQSYKVDYLIKSEGVPVMIIECKKASEDLNTHTGQLKGYFGATVAKIVDAGIKKACSAFSPTDLRINSSLTKANKTYWIRVLFGRSMFGLWTERP